MARSQQSEWAKNEMFLIIGKIMDPTIDDETLYGLFKKFHGWMLFAKDDTLLSVYLEVVQRRLLTMPLPLRRQAAKKVLECAKSYPYAKEYLEILQSAQKLLASSKKQ